MILCHHGYGYGVVKDVTKDRTTQQPPILYLPWGESSRKTWGLGHPSMIPL